MIIKKILLVSILALLVTACLEDEDAPEKNLQELLDEQTELTIFTEGLQRIGFYSDLNNIFVTLFAPSNQAFQRYFSDNGYSDINDVPVDTLEDILFYHIIAGLGTTSNTPSNYYATSNTNTPSDLNVRVLIENSGNSFILNNLANTVLEDLEGINGVLHIIDQVLTPPTLRDFLSQNSNLGTMREAFDDLGILDSIESGTFHTIFVPTDNAFASYYRQRQISNVDELPTAAYERLINSHAVLGNRDVETLADELRSPTLDDSTFLNFDEQLLNTGGGSSIFVVINDSSVIQLGNIQAIDGIMHLVSDVIPIRFQ